MSTLDETPAGLDDQPQNRGTRSRTAGVVIAIFLVMVFNYMDRTVLAVLLEPISRDLQLNDAALGLLAGLPFAVLYALVGVPFARVADVGNRRFLIAGSVAVWSVATAACGLATGFASLFMLRVLVGIGEGAGTPAAHSALADNVSTSQRALAASLFTLAATVGGFLGYALGGVLAGEFGWRFAFIAIGAPGVLVAALVLWLLPEKRVAPRWPSNAELFGSEALAVLGRLWRLPSFRLLVIGFTALYFVQMAVGQWAIVYLARETGKSIGEIGIAFGFVSAIPMAIGSVIGGTLGGMLAKRDSGWLLRLPGICAMLMAPGYALFLMTSDWNVAIVAMGGVSFISGVYLGPMFAAMYTIAPSSERATAVALVAVFTNIIGAGLGPFIVGVLSSLLTPVFDADALKLSLLASLVLFVPAVACFMLGSAHLPKDASHD